MTYKFNYDHQTKIPPRPKILSQSFLESAVETLIDNLIYQKLIDQKDKNQYYEDVLIENKFGLVSGYELAKRLDLIRGWDIDAEMVSALDNFADIANDELDKMHQFWADTHNIRLALSIGTRVKWKNKIGNIRGISKTKVCCYEVSFDDQPSNTYSIVPNEDIELLNNS